MFNIEEAKDFINRKMKYYDDRYFCAIREDRDYYYFVYRYTDEYRDHRELPVMRVNKSRHTVKVLYRNDNSWNKAFDAAREFYNKQENIDFSVDERAALRFKLFFPDEFVLCPRCGKKLVWSHFMNFTEVYCISRRCLYIKCFD